MTAPIPSPHFLFALCQPGAESLLKAELARIDPALRPAFSRRGFVTFKSPHPLEPDLALDSVFASEFGVSFGQGDVSAVAEHANRLTKDGRAPHLFVWSRDPAGESDTTATTVEAELRAHAPFASGAPEPGELVVDVVVAPGEPFSIGAHEHGPLHARTAGGVERVTPHPEAPSRAYSKIEEAIRWSGAAPRAGEIALEIGSAPGGASFALLQRGLTVHGVDPGAMSPRVLAYDGAGGPRFFHHRMPAGALKKADLPRPVHWFAMDMNLAPPVALRYAERIVMPLRRTLLGAVFTLKLNTPEDAAALPSLLRRIESFGFAWVKAKQLPTHRREIAVVAFSERGLATRAGPRVGSGAPSPPSRPARAAPP
jgi:23S rRNA (cytidine2498-2'-O)-methyltransferase